MTVRALARINVAAIERNVRRLRRELAGDVALCAVVKADGYGHGAVPAAHAALAGGARWLAVVASDEAATLRAAGIDAPILVMGALSPNELDVALAARADVVAWDEHFVDAVAARGGGAVHVKLDTGMGRLGTRDPARATRIAEAAATVDGVRFAGAMTHFATADDRDDRFIDEQLERFQAWIGPLRDAHPQIVAHAANSAAMLRDPATHFDLVRAGVAIYGLDPFGEDPQTRDLEPALLRLVLEDPRFFSDKGHPARRLLEQMTQRSLAWSAVDAPGFAAFYEPLQQAVDALLSTRVTGPDPFEFALSSLEEAWGEQSKRERRHRQKAVQALLHAEQRNLLAGKAREVGRFVTGPWSQVIAQARLADAAGGSDPGGYTAMLSDLLWSAQPQLAGGNHMRLARIAPRLLEKIREGLASIDYPQAEAQRFIDLLVVMQQKALVPAADAHTPMTAEELESWFAAPQSDERSPWLAPGEAQESGFMETHQAAVPAPLYEATQPGSASQVDTDWLDAVPSLGDDGLQPGAWVEMLTDGRWSRLQLTWASPHGTLYMFGDGAGKTHSMTRRLLDQLVASQGLRLVSDHAVVDGALDAVARTAVSNTPDLRL